MTLDAGSRPLVAPDLVQDASEVLGEAVMYAVATDSGTPAIFRFVAPDGRSFSETPGIIGPDGVVLSGTSAWIPTFGDAPVTFDLTVRGLDDRGLKRQWPHPPFWCCG